MIEDEVALRVSIDSKDIKKEAIKLILVLVLLEKYKRNRELIRIYTNFEGENYKCDVYFEYARDKVVSLYTIGNQNNLKTITIPFVNTQVIHINPLDFSNDINEIKIKLKEFV